MTTVSVKSFFAISTISPMMKNSSIGHHSVCRHAALSAFAMRDQPLLDSDHAFYQAV